MHRDTQNHSALFLVLLGTNLLLIFTVFEFGLPGLWEAWQSQEYSYGPLIPLLAVLIGWRRLADAKPKVESDWGGVAVLAVGAAMVAVAQLSAFEPPAHYGLIIGLTGLILAWFGRDFTRTVVPALIYLFFAIPLPRLIYVGLSSEMQLISSTLGVDLLQLFGVPVFQEGNVIDLGVYQLQVAEACNGLRYLFPLTGFSFLAALLYKGRMWKRVILFFSSAPLTIGMNSLRIAVIGVTVDQWGIRMAEGLLHDFEGWLVFLLCLLALFGEAAVLSRIVPDEGLRADLLLPPRHLPSIAGLKVTRPGLAFLSVCAVLAGFLSSGVIGGRAEILPRHPPFAAFPTDVDGWRGVPGNLDTRVLEALKPSDYWIADYRKDGGAAPVNFYMAYYESQRVGVSIHSPSNCIPGSGWEIAENAIVPIHVGVAGFSVTRMLIRKGDEALLVYYWFDERGRITNEQYGAKWHLLIDSILMHRSDGALLRLTTPLLRGEAEAAADRRLQDFLAGAYPLISAYVPGRRLQLSGMPVPPVP